MNITRTHSSQPVNRAALLRNLAQLFSMVADGGVEQSSTASEQNDGASEQSALNMSCAVPPDSIIAQVPAKRIKLVEVGS